jgi:hypothetical protein
MKKLIPISIISFLNVFPFGGHSISLRSQPGSTALWPTIAEERKAEYSK